jgi:hypothetical protein
MNSGERSSGKMIECANGRERVVRAPRVRVSIGVGLEFGPGSIVKAVIGNLSKDGFHLRTGAALHPGQSLTMHLPRETVACEIRWVDGRHAGGLFAEASAAPSW